MEEKNIKRKEWVKTAAIIFLLIMLVLTFFSNTIMNYSLPEVATEYVQSESITMQVRGTGTVESGGTYQVKFDYESDSSRIIKSVEVENGDEVKTGDVLFLLEEKKEEDTEEKELLLEQELLAALAKEEISLNAYNNVKNKSKMDVESYKNQILNQENAIKQIENSLAAWKQQKDITVKQLNELGLEVIEENSTLLKEELKNINNLLSEAKNMLELAQVDYDNCKAQLDTFDANVEAGIENEGTREALEIALADSQSRLEECKASVALYESKVAIINQYFVAEENLYITESNLGNAISIRTQLVQDMEKEHYFFGLKDEIANLKGKTSINAITAPINGTVYGLELRAGETIELNRDLCEIHPEGKGHTLSFSVTKKQAATLNVGDRGEVSNGWYFSDVVATLISVKPDPSDPTNSKKLTFNVEGDVTPGQTLTLAVGQRSANYDYTVPNNAIREDKDGKFILILEQKASPLGSRYYAVRRNVEVLASDDRRSAISGDVYAYEYVVTTSTKPIEEGQQVRLKDN